MKVKCKSIYAGPHGSGNPGQIIELPEKAAQELIDSGNGTAVDGPIKAIIETATIEPKETQESPKAKKKRK